MCRIHLVVLCIGGKKLEKTKFNLMEKGLRYIVTQASKDGTFQVGDHIRLMGDGSIICQEAGGWIGCEDVPRAVSGVEVVFDVEWYERKKEKLRKALDILESTTGKEVTNGHT